MPLDPWNSFFTKLITTYTSKGVQRDTGIGWQRVMDAMSD